MKEFDLIIQDEDRKTSLHFEEISELSLGILQDKPGVFLIFLKDFEKAGITGNLSVVVSGKSNSTAEKLFNGLGFPEIYQKKYGQIKLKKSIDKNIFILYCFDDIMKAMNSKRMIPSKSILEEALGDRLLVQSPMISNYDKYNLYCIYHKPTHQYFLTKSVKNSYDVEKWINLIKKNYQNVRRWTSSIPMFLFSRLYLSVDDFEVRNISQEITLNQAYHELKQYSLRLGTKGLLNVGVVPKKIWDHPAHQLFNEFYSIKTIYDKIQKDESVEYPDGIKTFQLYIDQVFMPKYRELIKVIPN